MILTSLPSNYIATAITHLLLTLTQIFCRHKHSNYPLIWVKRERLGVVAFVVCKVLQFARMRVYDPSDYVWLVLDLIQI